MRGDHGGTQDARRNRRATTRRHGFGVPRFSRGSSPGGAEGILRCAASTWGEHDFALQLITAGLAVGSVYSLIAWVSCFYSARVS